jgi:hypothetical protein
MFKATGTWIALIDPREKQASKPIVQLLDETKDRMSQDESNIKTNILTIHSVGSLVKDNRFTEGAKVVVDPRMPVAIIALDDRPKLEAEYVLVVQENQIMMVQ